MPEPSSIKLANALDAEGLHDLADRARADEFHDFRSPHATPATKLVAELHSCAAPDEFIERVMKGEFDADREESDRWLSSEQGKAAMRELGK